MSNPFALLPLAIAAHHGRVDDYEAQQLVAAGITLLQRSAALVRALSGKRSAILLPTSPQYFVALAASDGRGALLIDPRASRDEIARQLTDARVGAAFTSAALSPLLPSNMPRALLDDAPRRATVIADALPRDIDLGSHLGLSLEGEIDVPGSDDEAVLAYEPTGAGESSLRTFSHRTLLASARAESTMGDRVIAAARFWNPLELAVSGIGPLLAGGHIRTGGAISIL